MDIKTLIDKYYNSLNQKDDKWKGLWAGDAVFSDASMRLIAKGKEEIIQSFTTFLKGVEKAAVKQIIGEGEYVCVIVRYHYKNVKGERMQQEDAEVLMIREGKITQMTIYTDLTAYRNFMSD